MISVGSLPPYNPHSCSNVFSISWEDDDVVSYWMVNGNVKFALLCVGIVCFARYPEPRNALPSLVGNVAYMLYHVFNHTCQWRLLYSTSAISFSLSFLFQEHTTYRGMHIR